MLWYQFKNGLRVCSSNSAFNFQNISYKHKSGSLLSPFIADIVTDDLEIKCIASLPFHLPFYFRYVDDILTAVPSRKMTQLKTILIAMITKYNLQ